MNKTNNKVKNKGITLIALIITIIILLILAGVAISTLTGDDGLFKRAKDASEVSKKAELEEQVKLAVLASYSDSGEFSIDELNKNLKNNITGLTYNEKPLTDDTEGDNKNRIETLPAKVEISGYSIVINANGSVEEMPEEIADIIVNSKNYYGKKVTNYTAGGNTYRIFYVDKKGDFGATNTIYLKADYSTSPYDLNNYESYDKKNTKVKEMNPAWTKERGDKENDWKPNEQVAAYLCSPVNATNKGSTNLPWKTYFDENAADYVIGGPSVEMYVKSYNEAYKGETLTSGTIYTLGTNYRETYSPGYIYTLNGKQSTVSNNDYKTGNDTLDYTKFNSMYCGKKGSQTGSWWLASPSAINDSDVCLVYYYDADLNFSYYSNSATISPLVSLKSNFIPQVEE